MKYYKKTIFIFLLALITHKAYLWIKPFGPLLSEIPFSTEIVDRNGHLLRLSLADDQIYRLKTNLSNISPLFKETTLLYEDRYFYWHPGINPVSILRAFWSTFIKKKRAIGGSTITMQLSRSLFKINSRSIIGKLEQMLRALQLEFMYSKDEILEAYLNIVPYGFNIEGIGAVSRIYFNKPPHRLSLLESMTLSVFPQSPFERTKHIKASWMGDKFKRKHQANKIFKQKTFKYKVPKQEVSASNKNETPKHTDKSFKAARHSLLTQWLLENPHNVDKRLNFNLEIDMRHPQDLPFYAPHLVMEILGKKMEGLVVTSLDLSIQMAFEKVAQAYINQKKQFGINNMSALLVDTQSMETLAYLGSVDFFNDDIQGQVNGVLARRSPGSALKPFVYGLAIDNSVVHPLTMLKDAPTPFGTYTPDNFDSTFAGPLSTTEALVRSRNIPAIYLAQQLLILQLSEQQQTTLQPSEISAPTLYAFLHSLNIPLKPDPQHYGLSIVLGTAEVTMEELVQLYAIFNNRGKYRPLRKWITEKEQIGRITEDKWNMDRVEKKALSEEAAFLILDMLTTNPKPDGQSEDLWKLKPQSVAWKTGTSMGFRDAWAIGIFDHYVLATWVGHFSGQGNQAFQGRKVAGPLLFSLIEALAKIRNVNFSKPSPSSKLNLTSVEFCALSGSLAHKDCPHRKQGWFIPGVSPLHHCKVHRKIEVDLVSGYHVCPKFKGSSKSIVFEYWPTNLLKLFQKAGIGRKTPPSQHPDCRGEVFGDIGPKILSPKKAVVYNLRTLGADSKQIPLLALGDGNVKKISWYINNQFIGHTHVHHPLLWTAKAGRHNIRVIDDHGRSTETTFRVQWVD